MNWAGAVFAAFVLLIPLAYAEELYPPLECEVVSGSCPSGELCWLSLSNTTNAHVGFCNEYQYSLCCTRTVMAEFKAACAANEHPLLSVSSITKNAHAEEYFTFYNNYLCIQTATNTIFNQHTVTTRISPPLGYNCVLGLSNRTNAHVGDCVTDPYTFGLYVKTTVILPNETNNTIQVKIRIPGTSDTIYIPGTGQQNYSAISAQDYAGDPYILALNPGNQLYGLIASPNSQTLTKSIDKASNNYTIEIEQKRQGASVFVVFSKGSLENAIDRAAGAISGDELESLGYEIKEEEIATVGLTYDKLTFRNTRILSPGGYEVKLEHLGTRDNKIVLKVDTVER